MKERFVNLVLDTCRRNEIETLLEYLEHDTDFFNAPASIKNHDASPEGLVRHSIKVYENSMKLFYHFFEIHSLFCDDQSYDLFKRSLAFCSLFHDVCKINTYKEAKKWRKDSDGHWMSYRAYDFDKQSNYPTHGGESVYILQKFVYVDPKEAEAIAGHMGAYQCEDARTISELYRNNTLAWILHIADELDSFQPDIYNGTIK